MEFNLYSKSLIGARHIYEKSPCQDFSICSFENDVYVAGVCDGCGSKNHSEEGAKLIAECLANKIQIEFENLYEMSNYARKKYLNNFVYEQVIDYANSNGYVVGDLLSTYLFAAIKGNKSFVIRCGDGGIVVLYKDYSYEFFVEYKDDEINYTTYFNSYNVISKISTSIVDEKEILGILLFTDGIERFLISNNVLSKNVVGIIEINKSLDRDKVIKELDEFLMFLRDKDDNDDCSMAVLSVSKD